MDFRSTIPHPRAVALGLAMVCLACAAATRSVQAEMALVMVEEAGCIWCARWRADIGTAYPLTPEGRAAPLRPIDRADPTLEEFDLDSRLVFTPTFILIEEGRELGRIEGYPGADFFWFLLGNLLTEADPAWSAAATD